MKYITLQNIHINLSTIPFIHRYSYTGMDEGFKGHRYTSPPEYGIKFGPDLKFSFNTEEERDSVYLWLEKLIKSQKPPGTMS